MMQEIIELTIVADTNDADYVTEVNVIDQETLSRFMPLIVAIKTIGNRHNWENNWECARNPEPAEMYSDINPDIIEEFNDCVPYGVHTIYKIQVRRLIVVEEINHLA